jgi:hypothetical protein
VAVRALATGAQLFLEQSPMTSHKMIVVFLARLSDLAKASRNERCAEIAVGQETAMLTSSD